MCRKKTVKQEELGTSNKPGLLIRRSKRENQEKWEKRKDLVHSGLVRVRNPIPEASEAGSLTISGCKTFLIPHTLLRFGLKNSIDSFYSILKTGQNRPIETG